MYKPQHSSYLTRALKTVGATLLSVPLVIGINGCSDTKAKIEDTIQAELAGKNKGNNTYTLDYSIDAIQIGTQLGLKPGDKIRVTYPTKATEPFEDLIKNCLERQYPLIGELQKCKIATSISGEEGQGTTKPYNGVEIFRVLPYATQKDENRITIWFREKLEKGKEAWKDFDEEFELTETGKVLLEKAHNRGEKALDEIKRFDEEYEVSKRAGEKVWELKENVKDGIKRGLKWLRE